MCISINNNVVQKFYKNSNNDKLFFLDSDAPPRPPLPAEMAGHTGGGMPGSRSGHHDTTTDDESEEIFQKAPTPSAGPIMVIDISSQNIIFGFS